MRIPPISDTRQVDNAANIPEGHSEDILYKTTEQIGEKMRITVVIKTKYSRYKCMDILLNLVKNNLGWNLLVVTMMSTQLEVISYCYLNIVHLDESASMLIGSIIIIVILTLYGVIGYYLIRGGMYGYHIVKITIVRIRSKRKKRKVV